MESRNIKQEGTLMKISKKAIEESVSFKGKKRKITLDLPVSTFIFLAEEAHKRDITFNQIVSAILIDEIHRLNKKR